MSVDTIVGESPAMQKVMELVQHVAKTDATVLIRGESGTGKELIARAIHAGSARRYFPIVPVNCGALPENLLESELFGHEKGAFTGAQYRRKGKIEMADGGTLFLDEVGAISQKMQVDLLRVLETKEFTRVGGTQRSRWTSASSAPPMRTWNRRWKKGRFREDFYYRINVFTIEVPPLREPPLRHPLAGRSLSRPVRQADGQAHHRHQPRSDGSAHGPRLAGQRARAVQRHRARDGGGQAAGHPARGPAAARTATRRDSGRRVRWRTWRSALRRRARAHGLEHHACRRVLQVDRVTVYNKMQEVRSASRSSCDVLRLIPIYCGARAPLLQPLAAPIDASLSACASNSIRRASIPSWPSMRPEANTTRASCWQLLRDAPRDTARVLGVTAVDLFIPVLTFVFGEAQLEGRAAVVSTYRLDSEIYGLPADPELLFERLCKEAVHELGHTYDLMHCHESRCVMLSSTYVEEIDLKSDQFCSRCRAKSPLGGRLRQALPGGTCQVGF